MRADGVLMVLLLFLDVRYYDCCDSESGYTPILCTSTALLRAVTCHTLPDFLSFFQVAQAPRGCYGCHMPPGKNILPRRKVREKNNIWERGCDRNIFDLAPQEMGLVMYHSTKDNLYNNLYNHPLPSPGQCINIAKKYDNEMIEQKRLEIG